MVGDGVLEPQSSAKNAQRFHKVGLWGYGRFSLERAEGHIPVHVCHQRSISDHLGSAHRGTSPLTERIETTQECDFIINLIMSRLQNMSLAANRESDFPKSDISAKERKSFLSGELGG